MIYVYMYMILLPIPFDVKALFIGEDGIPFELMDLQRHLPAEVAGQTVEEQLARLVTLTSRAEIVAPLELRIMVHLLIGFNGF